MKKVRVIILLCFTFALIQSNASVMGFIDFPFAQSVFTRFDYFILGIIGLVVAILLYLLYVQVSKKSNEFSLVINIIEIGIYVFFILEYAYFYTLRSSINMCYICGVFLPVPWIPHYLLYFVENALIIYLLVKVIIRTKRKETI